MRDEALTPQHRRPQHRRPHLRVAVTGHGYGHATQAGSVVRALRERLPDLRVSVQTTLPRDYMQRVLGGPVEMVPGLPDPGMAMSSGLDVDVEGSAAAYAAFHESWDGRIAGAAAELAAARPDLLLADVPYLPIAAAARAGIPAVALCSLNWADVYAAYCGDRPEAPRIRAEILAAYAAAETFLVCEPGLPMPDLGNVRRIGPCAALGRDRRADLRRQLGVTPDARVVLVAMGGIPLVTDCYARWPAVAGTHWIIQAERLPDRPDMTRMDAVDMAPIDQLCSSDALVGKLGYSYPVECGCNAIPFVYIPRQDWPENPHVAAWVARHCRFAVIDQPEFESGAFIAELDAVIGAPPPEPARPTGVAEAVGILMPYLAR